MNYWKLIKQDWPLLSFGFLLTALTGPGQTYFVGLFRDSITAHFNITIGDFGLIFSLATLASAVVFFWTGKLIDRWNLRYAVIVFCLVFALSSGVVGLAPNLLIFVIGIFGVRHLGQALMSHVSSTTMARYFDHNRAKAISLASMGYAAGEAIFPVTIVAIMALIGWHETWVLIAGMIMLIFLPVALFLLNQTHRDLSLNITKTSNKTITTKDVYSSEEERHWTRKEVIGDKRFWLMLPAMFSSPYLLTGLFFHQASLAAEGGLELKEVAGFFTVFAVAKIIGSLFAGPLVDRYGYLKLYPPCIVGLMIAFYLLSASYSYVNILSFYALAGLSIGGIIPVTGSLWPGFYGLRHLGAIRSMAASIIVIATGLAPATYGYMLDSGITLKQINAASSFYCLVATLFLIFMVVGEHKRVSRTY